MAEPTKWTRFKNYPHAAFEYNMSNLKWNDQCFLNVCISIFWDTNNKQFWKIQETNNCPNASLSSPQMNIITLISYHA